MHHVIDTTIEGFLERALQVLRCIHKHLEHPPTPGLDDARGARAVSAAVKFAEFEPLWPPIDAIHVAVTGRHYTFRHPRTGAEVVLRADPRPATPSSELQPVRHHGLGATVVKYVLLALVTAIIMGWRSC